MPNYKDDPGFKALLDKENVDQFDDYNSLDFLDRDIAELVYLMFKLPFLETQWSCSGHYGEQLMDAGRALHQGNVVYQTGFIKFTLTEHTERALLFLKNLRDIIKKYPFSSLQYKKEEDCFWIVLEMRDLVQPEETGEILTVQEQEEPLKDPDDFLAIAERKIETNLERFAVKSSIPKNTLLKFASRELPREKATARYGEFLALWGELKELAKTQLH